MPLHSTLTGAELHEPKGADAASLGEVYVSDGAGSGAWSYLKSGWGNYSDNAGTQVFTTTPARLAVNALGAGTNIAYLPREIRGSGALWDPTTRRVTPIAEGDTYNLRVDLPVTAETASPTEVTMFVDIQAGTVFGTAVRIAQDFRSTGRTVPYTISFSVPVFVGSTFIVNGAQIWLYTDVGSVTVTNPSIFISRVHGEYT